MNFGISDFMEATTIASAEVPTACNREPNKSITNANSERMKKEG